MNKTPTHIHFIINPIAGSGNNTIDLKMLHQYFDSNSNTLLVKYSTYKKHATVLAKDSISEGADIIVACGGDGTINEVASCLVNTSIILGIIPIGSGNGLASCLNIPKNLTKAILRIKECRVKKIDVGSIDNNYFFSNSGVGIDAKVIKHYEDSNSRRLLSYVRASLKSLKELRHENLMTIEVNEETIQINPFMVFVSNSNELGYNVSLTPKASLQDGLLDVLLISKLSKLKMLLFGILLLFKKHHIIKEAKSFQTKKIQLTKHDGSPFQSQIDGEYHALNVASISISILEESLQVIA
ncbi:diacylglycerol kinase [Flavobacteriales bacterium 34_180_T64]|nr:diacylglycerol kinase [Flavobacteriales bacterium 34_180_T64]